MSTCPTCFGTGHCLACRGGGNRGNPLTEHTPDVEYAAYQPPFGFPPSGPRGRGWHLPKAAASAALRPAFGWPARLRASVPLRGRPAMGSGIKLQ